MNLLHKVDIAFTFNKNKDVKQPPPPVLNIGDFVLFI